MNISLKLAREEEDYFVSQEELLRAIRTSKWLFLDRSFWQNILLRNRYRDEYSLKKLIVSIVQKGLCKL